MKKTLLALALAAATPLAFANGYVGGSYSTFDFSINGSNKELSVGAISVIGGYQISDYVAVEARVGAGVGDDRFLGWTLELDNYFGAYVKAGMPINDFYPYALLGMTKGELSPSGYGLSDSDMSYGVGLAYKVNDQVSLNAEYANMLDKGGVTIDGFTFGAAYHF